MDQNPDQKAKEVIEALRPSHQATESVWLALARELSNLVKEESSEVQAVSWDMSRKVYPETWRARREKEKEESEE